jgi:hypothetical protein
MEKFDCGGNLATSMGAFPRLSHAFPLWESTPVPYSEPITSNYLKSLEKSCNTITIYYNILQSLHFNNVQF